MLSGVTGVFPAGLVFVIVFVMWTCCSVFWPFLFTACALGTRPSGSDHLSVSQPCRVKLRPFLWTGTRSNVDNSCPPVRDPGRGGATLSSWDRFQSEA